MDLTGSHVRSVQVAGNGYVETRDFWFSPNAELLMVKVTAVATDGTTTNWIGTNDDGVISTDGVTRYPDGTLMSGGFSADGRVWISHGRSESRDSTHWRYQADGTAEANQTEWLPDGGYSTTYWSLAPDGAPVGDVRESSLVFLPDGHKEIDTVRRRDGTVITRTRVMNEQGDVLSDETTEVHFDTNPQLPPADGREVKRPAMGSGGPGGQAGGVEPTTRTPDPTVTAGGGWVGGSGPTIVEHITDWWYRSTDGRVTYLGSSVKAKTKEV